MTKKFVVKKNKVLDPIEKQLEYFNEIFYDYADSILATRIKFLVNEIKGETEALLKKL